jgi:hypothetical protein
MPDIFYSVVQSITQPPRLVEVSTVTTKTETVLVSPDGTRIPQEPKIKTETVEKWSVKAMVDKEWVGVAEEEFFFPTEAACAVIKPGYKHAF